MKASILIPTYGSRLEYLRDTLASLAKQDYPSQDFEVIVIDNGPSGKVKAVVEAAAHAGAGPIHYIKEEVAGAARARHTGVRHAKGEVYVFTDDDVIAPVEWLTEVMRPFNDASISCVGGKVVLDFEKDPPDWWAKQFNRGYLSLLDHGDTTKTLQYPDFVWSCNMAVRKEVFYRVGGFNPDFSGDPKKFWLTGDNECGLLKKIYDLHGVVIYSPAAWVHHRIPASRLTPKYFYDRHYIEGVMDSFTHVRTHEGKSLVSLRLLIYSGLYFVLSFKKILGALVKRSYAMKMKADALRYLSMAQHHALAAVSPKLRQYIWQKSYL